MDFRIDAGKNPRSHIIVGEPHAVEDIRAKAVFKQAKARSWNVNNVLYICNMEATKDLKLKRAIILAVIVIVAFILGRLAVRALGCMLLGGTLFGGNVL